MEKAVLKMNQPLPVQWFQRSPEIVAQELIGKILVVIEPDGTVLKARIVETEAYLAAGDPASHSYRGRTRRNAAMFADGGVWYVYRIYGIHLCVNVVTETEGRGSAVLIRAAEPLAGVERMQQRRKIRDVRRLLRGPANFAKAFGFQLADNFQPVVQPHRFFQDAPDTVPVVKRSPRIGISRAQSMLLRFYDAQSAFCSR